MVVGGNESSSSILELVGGSSTISNVIFRFLGDED